MSALLLAILTRVAGGASAGGGGGGGGDVPAANALPAGALSFTVNWDNQAGESGYIVYVATASQNSPDPALYPYRYLVAADVLSLVIASVQAGTKYVRVAAYQSNYVGDLSHEVAYTPA